jgi:putative hydrolase of the HAD superfamily
MPHHIKWVVFDSTGTLMTPYPSVGEVYHRLSMQYGSSRTVEEIQVRAKQAMATHFGRPDAPQHGPPTNEAMERSRWQRIVYESLSDLPAADQESAFDTLWEHFAMPTAWRLFPEVDATLRRLYSAGIEVAVASNFDSRLYQIMRSFDATRNLQHILVSAQLGWSKPDPRFFIAAARHLNIVDPQHVLMIGDDLLNDVAASRAAGWHAELVNREQDDSLLAALDRWGVGEARS